MAEQRQSLLLSRARSTHPHEFSSGTHKTGKLITITFSERATHDALYAKPIVVTGFEPLDILQSVFMIYGAAGKLVASSVTVMALLPSGDFSFANCLVGRDTTHRYLSMIVRWPRIAATHHKRRRAL
ncbi:MAG: hypothetical protein M3R69_06895 [Acidobacteriota bacterium]|nr:hypothetical protein [Acidobacteriota bacterium]